MRRHIACSIILFASVILIATALLLHHAQAQSAWAWHQEVATARNGGSEDDVKLSEDAPRLADEEEGDGQGEGDQEKEPSGWNRLWDAPKLG